VTRQGSRAPNRESRLRDSPLTSTEATFPGNEYTGPLFELVNRAGFPGESRLRGNRHADWSSLTVVQGQVRDPRASTCDFRPGAGAAPEALLPAVERLVSGPTSRRPVRLRAVLVAIEMTRFPRDQKDQRVSAGCADPALLLSSKPPVELRPTIEATRSEELDD
jgi:hypothetical protein